MAGETIPCAICKKQMVTLPCLTKTGMFSYIHSDYRCGECNAAIAEAVEQARNRDDEDRHERCPPCT